MSNFNFGIDCSSEDEASALHDEISSLDIYQESLELYESRVSLVSKQPLLDFLKNYSESKSVGLSIEVWPADQDFDEAEENGSMEYFNYG